MLKKMLCSALLMSAAAGAHAQAPLQTWTFSYTGFILDPTNGPPDWDPTATLKGSFSGRDLNGDGILRPRELSSFIFEDRQYTRCTATTNMFSGCSLKDFSFSEDGGLSFRLSWFEGEPVGEAGQYSRYDGHTETGNVNYWHWDWPGGDWYRTHQWTGQTALTIVQVVPEPSSMAMAAGGALLLLAVGRRRLRGRP